MKRREFIPRAIVGSSIIAAVPLLATSCEEEDPVTPDDNNGKDPVDNNNNTHNGCTVDYDDNSNKLECPCHGSEFSTSGSVLKGPASSPLETYMVTREGDILTIK